MQSDTTCYPPFSFLPLQWDHRPRRNFFLDCGTLGSIYICEDGKTLTQKLHEGGKVSHLSAQHPSLPLFEKPKYGISDIELVGQENFKQRNKNFRLLIKRIKELRTMLKRKKLDSSIIMDLLSCVNDYENGDCSKDKVFKKFNGIPHLRNLYERHSSLFNVTDIQKTNTDFTGGGCLQIVNFPDEPPLTAENNSVCMAAVSGLNLDKIKIFRADIEKSGLLSVNESQVIEIESPQPLLELSNQCIYDRSLCAARTKKSCLMYEIFCENFLRSSCVNEIKFEKEILTSVFMSPYIPAECLVMTDNGTVYLWNADKGHDPVYKQPRKLDHLSSWKDVHYGSHPRSIVITNHKTMDLIDIRTCGRKVNTLFSLPNEQLRDKERLQVSKYSNSNSFHHFLATDYALFLLDERFPQYPVLQWQHMLEGLPQYMCLVPGVVQSPRDDVILIGSLHPPETISIQYRTNEQGPPVSVCSPWRISKILDFSYINNMHNKLEDALIKKRLTASNIGITGSCLKPEGMIVFQMNSLGDIFFQKYNLSRKFDDKTCSAGPGDHVVQLSMEAKCRFHYWMDHLRENVEEQLFCDAEHQDIKAIIKSLSHPPSSHVLCRLCMPQCDNEDIESDDEDVINGTCTTCNSTLRKSKWIVDGVEQEKVIQSRDISVEKEMPSKDDLLNSSNPLTKTLYKLWNDEELSEEDEELSGGGDDNEEENQEKEKNDDKEKERPEGGEEEEEEEEKEEEKNMNTQTTRNKSDFQFVCWDEDDSGEDEPKIPTGTKYNVPETLQEDCDEPHSPLLFESAQSQKPAAVPDSFPVLFESHQKPQSPAVFPSTNPFPESSQMSVINKNESQRQLPNSPCSKGSSSDDRIVKTPTTQKRRKRKSLNFADKSSSSKNNLSCFLSPILSQNQRDSFQRTPLAKNFVYEEGEGFGKITETENIDNSCLLSKFSFLNDDNNENRLKNSWKRPSLERSYEDGF